MAESLISIVTKTLVVQEALKKPERDKSQKKSVKKNKANKKDSAHIIDTYA
jgi:hypothetical protein|tara:strand:- start:137 stop:289 length:153 start_codon:yes stop_codon:yes gene_type:complete